jgi:hypothetical protein
MGSHHSGESDDADAEPMLSCEDPYRKIWVEAWARRKRGKGMATTRRTILAVRES